MGYENRVASNSTIIRTTMNHSSKIEDSVQDKNLTQTILGFSYFTYLLHISCIRTLKMTEQTENDLDIQIHKYQHSNISVLPYFLLLAQN